MKIKGIAREDIKCGQILELDPSNGDTYVMHVCRPIIMKNASCRSIDDRGTIYAEKAFIPECEKCHKKLKAEWQVDE